MPHSTDSVLQSNLGGGPLGLGDPNSLHLRHVETDILIPKIAKQIATEKCSDLVAEFTKCGRAHGFMFPFRCKKESREMQLCILKWFQDPEIMARSKVQYLEERSTYRRTGIAKKMKRYNA